MRLTPNAQRSIAARAALAAYRSCRPEYRWQYKDQWLYHATAAEVRRNWRRWMGVMPSWAVAQSHHSAIVPPMAPAPIDIIGTMTGAEAQAMVSLAQAGCTSIRFRGLSHMEFDTKDIFLELRRCGVDEDMADDVISRMD